MFKKITEKQNIFIILSFCFFAFMLLFNLTHSSLWGDEWAEYYFSQNAIKTGELYNKVISTFQPPLYNFLMHFWLMIGKSILWFRGFNVVVGMLSAFFLFKSISKFYGKNIACFSLVALSMTYQWVYCMQEAAEYALMLGCLFGVIWFYIDSIDNFNYKNMTGFILFNIAALYSQYGAVFIAAPFLVLYYFQIVLNRDSNKKRKIVITVFYFVSFLVFALPLYFRYLRIQMANNAISDNAEKLSAGLLREMPFTLGRIIGYLFNLDNGDLWTSLYGIISVILIAAAVFLLFKSNICKIKKSLISILLIGYTLHYILVQLQIYGMLHPGQSSGFYGRYSYFYIPLLAVTLPVIIIEIKNCISESSGGVLFMFSIYTICLLSLFVSWIGALENWNKTYDKEFAQIWMANEGWNDVTYLYGMAALGSNYYISKSEGFSEGYLNNMRDRIDLDNLPEKFWVWRTNWGSFAEAWQPTIDYAAEHGYIVIVYKDEGDAGQLAYCTRKY